MGAKPASSWSPIRFGDPSEWKPYLDEPSRITAFGPSDHWYRASIYENPLFDRSALVRLLIDGLDPGR